MSATPNFTPGPWFWLGSELRTRADMGRKPSFRGWLVPVEPRQDAPAPAANRALIVAAPKMHAALEAVLAVFNAPGEPDPLMAFATIESIRAILEEVAAVKGQS